MKKPNFKQIIGATLKSFFGGYDWVSSGDPGNKYSSWGGRGLGLVGTAIDWDRVTGDLLQNSIAVACYKWIWQNFNQAQLQVQKRLPTGDSEVVENHALVALLSSPNAYQDWQTINAALLHDLLCDGNGYLVVNNRAGSIAKGLVWISANRMRPESDDKTGMVPLTHWRLTLPNGGYQNLPVEDVIHFRMGVDPFEPRLGFAPYKSLKRQQYTLDQAANYGANIMRNMGVVGGIATPKTETLTFDPETFVERWNAKTRGDSVGEILALDVPVDVQFPKNNPQTMALDTIQDRPESDICAVLGVPPQVVGAHVGRLSKTYANMKEAREIAWEETLIPLLNLIAGTLSRYLLPQVVGSEALSQFVTFNISAIRPLQPDLDALHARARADWQANLIDRATWKRAVGQVALPEDKGVYYQDTLGGGIGAATDLAGGSGTKSKRGLEKKGAALERYNDDRIWGELGLLNECE
jgi:phage portal protein BeeE